MTLTHAAPRHLNEVTAMAAYRQVCDALQRVFGEQFTPAEHPVHQGDGDPAWFTAPVLVEDFSMWHSETRWAVVWEGGPGDWPLFIDGDLRLPDGVGCDAFASFALSLFPEED